MSVSDLLLSTVDISEQMSLSMWALSALQCEGEVVLWLEKTCFTRTELALLAACPGGLSSSSLPIRELHVNLFLMGNYLLFSFVGKGGGWRL